MLRVEFVNRRDFDQIQTLLDAAAQRKSGRSEEWVTGQVMAQWCSETESGRTHFMKAVRGTEILGIGALRFDARVEATVEGFRVFNALAGASQAQRKAEEMILTTPGEALLLEAIKSAYNRPASWYDANFGDAPLQREKNDPIIVRAIVASDNRRLLSNLRRTGFADTRYAKRIQQIDMKFDVEAVLQTMEFNQAASSDAIKSNSRNVDGLSWSVVPVTGLEAAWDRFCEFRKQEDALIADHRHRYDTSLDRQIEQVQGLGGGYVMREWCAFYLSKEYFRSAGLKGQVVQVNDRAGAPVGYFIVSADQCGIRKTPTLQCEALAFRFARAVGEANKTNKENYSTARAVARMITDYAMVKDLNILVHFPSGSLVQNAFARLGYSVAAPVDRWYQEIVLRRLVNSSTIDQIERRLDGIVRSR